MKTRYLSGIIAIFSTIAFVVALIIINSYFKENIFLPTVIATILFFIINYLIVRYWIRREIYEKVRTIYKNIYNFKVSKIDLKQKVKSSIIGLDQVNEEVTQWMEENNKQIDNMIALEQYRKEYIGNVAHELRTPIFNIQGYVSTLLDGAMEDPNLLKKYLLRADAGIDRLIAIVQDLDTITQLELNEVQLDITTFDITQVIRDVIESFELKAKERNINVVLQHQEAVMVEADKSKIRQVLVNLIENGIKYSKDKGGEVRIKTFDMEDQYLIEVSDHGIGIGEKDINRVFERFFRTDKARSRQFGGTGLGLAIVKHIIEAHNQTINVRSKYGEGTVFGFTLKKG
jgi:two-component system, OmpR family, phosphate regulon sensor histidine kinase PhoR